MNWWGEDDFFFEPEEEIDYVFEDAKEDLKDFFTNPDHWVFKYGSPSECRPEDPYFLNQLAVLFEKKYFHWITNRAAHELVEEGFLKQMKRNAIPGEVIFVQRADVRYYKRRVKELINVIDFYSHYSMSSAYGDYAEILFKLTLRAEGFKVLGEHTKSFGGRTWTKTDNNLDLILEKDGVTYGVEIKNTLSYIPRDEFETKMKDMCDYLGLRPLCIFRNAPKSLFPEILARKGFFLLFKTQIYPPGFEKQTAWIWKKARLPVSVWKSIPDGIIKRFLDWHNKQI
jgi:hypothetical protein